MNKCKRKFIYKIIIIVGVALMMSAIMYITDRETIDEYPELIAAGEKVLTPVDTKQTRTEYYIKGSGRQVSITNYVGFHVDIEDETRFVWISTYSAYGDDDAILGIDSVRNKKTIKRYVFYASEHVYVSTKYSNVKDYVLNEIGLKLILPAGIALGGIFVMLLQWLISLRPLPKVQSEEYGVCRHNSMIYIVLMLISLGALCIFAGVVINMALPSGEIVYLVMFGLLFMLFLALTLWILLMVCNRTIIVTETEVIYRDTFGRVYHYPASEVTGYKETSGYRYRNLRIVTKDKNIDIRVDCVDGAQIQEYLVRYYQLLQ